MTPTERKTLIAAALADADALWTIKTATVRLAGPWSTAWHDSSYRIEGGVWRQDPQGQAVAVASPSQPPLEPELYDFHDYYDEDGELKYSREDQFASEMVEYERSKAEWKPWTFLAKDTPVWRSGLADTMEEAMALADTELQNMRYLLVKNTELPVPAGSKPPVPA